MKSLGKHLIVEFHGCDPVVMNDSDACQAHILEAVRLSGATVIQPFFHKFNPHGVSGIVVIAESHFSIHTWPEFGYCALDVFTCGDDIKSEPAVAYLKSSFKATHHSIMEIKRGLLDLPSSEVKYKPEMEAT